MSRTKSGNAGLKHISTHRHNRHRSSFVICIRTFANGKAMYVRSIVCRYSTRCTKHAQLLPNIDNYWIRFAHQSGLDEGSGQNSAAVSNVFQ